MKVMVETNKGWFRYNKVKSVSVDSPVHGGLIIRFHGSYNNLRYFPNKSYKSVEIR